MESKGESHGAALVVVRHPADGRTGNGRDICDTIKAKLRGHRGKVYIFHDATDMQVADIGYAKAFQCLDKDLLGFSVHIVCVIPSLVPRVMALTVVKASPHDWSIFKTFGEAERHLAARGVKLSGMWSGRENVVVRTINMPQAA
ncbi:MAG: hypothetical protein HZA22_02975 [Nitrospirae bacterium]|nr:hypothetical protein [Nitrospirota bacterium]